MADKPVENLIYDFLAENFDEFLAEDEEAETADFEINPSAYDKRLKNSGIFVGDADTNGGFDFQDSFKEYDGLLALEIYSRVQGHDKTDRSPARQRVFEIKEKILELLRTKPQLNGRGCDVLALRQRRYFEDTSADKWAIETIPIVINPVKIGE